MASVHVVQLYLNISFICYCWWSTRGNCSRRYIARLQNGRQTFSGDMWSEIDARSSCIAICRLSLSQRKIWKCLFVLAPPREDQSSFLCYLLLHCFHGHLLAYPLQAPFPDTIPWFCGMTLKSEMSTMSWLISIMILFEWEESFILRLDGKVALGEYKLNSPYRWAYKVYWFKLQKFQGSSETSSVFPFLAATDIEDAMNKGKGKSHYHYTSREWFQKSGSFCISC